MGWRKICKPQILKCYKTTSAKKVETGEVCITYGFNLLKGLADKTAASGLLATTAKNGRYAKIAKGNSNTISALHVLYQADSSQLTLWLNLPRESPARRCLLLTIRTP